MAGTRVAELFASIGLEDSALTGSLAGLRNTMAAPLQAAMNIGQGIISKGFSSMGLAATSALYGDMQTAVEHAGGFLTGVLANVVSTSVQLVTGTAAKILQIGGSIIGGVASFAGKAIGSIGGAIGGFIPLVGGVLGGIAGTLGNLLGAVGGAIGSTLGAVGSAIGVLGEKVGNFLGGLINTIGQSISGVVGAFVGAITGPAFAQLKGSLTDFNYWTVIAINAKSALVQFNAAMTDAGARIGFTRDQFKRMSDEIEKKSSFGGGAIREAMVALSVYDRVRGDVFKRAIEGAADIAEVWDKDLVETARQLGRALDEPDHALRMLRQLSISLSDEQKRAFAGTTDVLTKQNIILGAVETKMKSMGEAKMGTTKFDLSKLAQEWGKVGKSIGDIFEPLAGLFAKIMRSVVGTLGEITGPIFGDMKAGVVGFVNDAKAWIDQNKATFQEWARTVGGIVMNVWNLIKEGLRSLFGGGVQDQANNFWDGFKQGVTDALNLIRTITSSWENVKTAADYAWAQIKVTAITAWDAISGYLGSALTKVFDFLGGRFVVMINNILREMNSVTRGALGLGGLTESLAKNPAVKLDELEHALTLAKNIQLVLQGKIGEGHPMNEQIRMALADQERLMGRRFKEGEIEAKIADLERQKLELMKQQTDEKVEQVGKSDALIAAEKKLADAKKTFDDMREAGAAKAALDDARAAAEKAAKEKEELGGGKGPPLEGGKGKIEMVGFKDLASKIQSGLTGDPSLAKQDKIIENGNKANDKLAQIVEKLDGNQGGPASYAA